MRRGHRFHRGEFYKKNAYNEWQYFTFIGTDKKTGDKIAFFVCPFSQGWVKAHNGPANPLNFAFINLDTKEFYSANTMLEGNYTPTKFWKSPKTGQVFPWYGTMKTPLGEFYFSPPFPEQETQANNPKYSFIEGFAQIRTGSPDGPIVGRGFVELAAKPISKAFSE